MNGEITFREQELNWLFAKYKRLENNPLYGNTREIFWNCTNFSTLMVLHSHHKIVINTQGVVTEGVHRVQLARLLSAKTYQWVVQHKQLATTTLSKNILGRQLLLNQRLIA